MTPLYTEQDVARLEEDSGGAWCLRVVNYQTMKHKAGWVTGVLLLLSLAGLEGSGKGDIGDMERAIYKKINAYRAGKGLDRLSWNQSLADQARAHSVAMARGKRGFGHGGFKERVRATGLTFRSAAENVGQNQGYDDPAAEAVEGWIHSQGHRANIEGRYSLTGVGVARSRNGTFFFTQVFMLTDGEE